MRKYALRLAGAAWAATPLFWLAASAEAQIPPTPTETVITLQDQNSGAPIFDNGTIAAGDPVSDFAVVLQLPSEQRATDGILTELEHLGAACTGTVVGGGVIPDTTAVLVYDTTNFAGQLLSFQNRYSGSEAFFPSESPCVTVSVQQASCTSLDTVTITPAFASGPNPVNPNTPGSWTYTFKVQNCTPTNGLALKVQGGGAGWLTSLSPATDTGTCSTKLLNKNTVATCNLSLDSNRTATITITANGTTPKSRNDSLSVSGIWSVAWTPTDPVQTGSTDAANNVTICSDSNPANCGGSPY